MIKIFAAAALLAAASPALAQYTTVDLSDYTNGSWASQGFGSVPSGTTAFGGTPFAISGNGSGDYVSFAFGAPTTIVVPIGIADVTKVYTLINTFWGQPGTPGLHEVTFNATGGVSQTFDLVDGTDVRDYANNNWANTINGTTTQQVFCQDSCYRRLDRQEFTLSSAFAGQTLTSITFQDNGGDSYSRMTLTGLTVLSAAVPETASWMLMIGGFGMVGAGMRAQRRTLRFARSAA